MNGAPTRAFSVFAPDGVCKVVSDDSLELHTGYCMPLPVCSFHEQARSSTATVSSSVYYSQSVH